MIVIEVNCHESQQMPTTEKKVKSRIEQNSRRSARKIARDIVVPHESVHQMIKNYL